MWPKIFNNNQNLMIFSRKKEIIFVTEYFIFIFCHFGEIFYTQKTLVRPLVKLLPNT